MNPIQQLINQAEARHGPARKEPMNDAQKNAIREADSYLRCAGLPTYSQVTAQPAAVSDEQIIAACADIYLSDYPQGSQSYDLAIARAILALRPQAVPMTVDQAWHSDTLMAANGIAGFKMDALMRIVRAVEAHHGITAQAKEGGA